MPAAAAAEPSKQELKDKLDNALRAGARARAELKEAEKAVVDGLFGVAGGAIGGIICRELGPSGEETWDIPMNILAGGLLVAIGLSEWAGDLSPTVAATGLGMLSFQTGLMFYGDGYQADA